MQRSWRIIFKYTIILALVICLVLCMPIPKSEATSNINKDKKAIIFILDEVSLEEIINSNTPNIDILMKNGAIGLMNTRAKSSLSNKGSTYLSLGMGVRTLASTKGGLAFEKNKMYPMSNSNLMQKHITASDLYKLYTGKNPPDGEIINVAIGDIKKTALDITPNNNVGLLGKISKENNLVIGVTGNSDLNTPAREITMLAMDENGVIPYGSVGSDLLITDTNILGGIKLNQSKLLNEVERILPNIDMLFIDYGDAARIQKTGQLATETVRENQKFKAITAQIMLH